MNVLKFTIPVPGDQNIILKDEDGAFFYPHLHRHDEIQLTWIQKGNGTLVVNNGLYPFRPDTIFMIGANQPHVFKSDPVYFNSKSKKTIKALTIFFNPGGKLAHLFGLAEMKPVYNLLSKFSSGLIIPGKLVPEISNRMNHLFQIKETEQMVGFIELLNRIVSIPAPVMLAGRNENKLVTEHEGIRISNIYHHIMMNYCKQITLEEIAEKANMTPEAFCRYFKKRTLKTFISFLNEVRIREACNRLTENNFDGISTIAYNCGFNSVTHFNRVFKNLIGKSPSEYMKNYASKAYSFAN